MSFYDNQPLTAASVLNEVTSIPQELYQNEGNVVATVAGTSSASNGEVISGMTIFNNTNPGTIAYAAVPPTGIVNNQPAQRLICSINSNHEHPSSRIIDFTTKPKELDETREKQLFMHVYPYQTESMANGERGPLYTNGTQANLIPLLVSPGSVSLAPPLTSEELDTLGFTESAPLGIDFSGIMKGIVKSVPIVADAGLKIYQELSGAQSVAMRNKSQNVAILGLLGSVASIAVPLVGSLIKKVLD